MNELLVATIMGIVQGFTEFLPISSTGHLIITGTLLGQENTPRMATFEVVIQLGSILAVVVLYWRRFWGLVVPQSDTSFSGIRGIGLLVLTSLPASLLGLVAHEAIKTHLFNPISVALALAVGGIFILLAEGRKAKPRLTQIDDITPKFALLVGCFQCLSLWPGFSRSASTIMGGLFLGARREVAAEYSFLAAVPIMVAATAYSLLKTYKVLSIDDLPFFAVGTFVSFIAALAAIKVLLAIISTTSFRPFAWYRLLIAPIIFYFWM